MQLEEGSRLVVDEDGQIVSDSPYFNEINSQLP